MLLVSLIEWSVLSELRTENNSVRVHLWSSQRERRRGLCFRQITWTVRRHRYVAITVWDVSILWLLGFGCVHIDMSLWQRSYRSGKNGKSQWISVVRERSGKYFLEKSEKMKNWCHQMSDFLA